ncbi:MAG: tRNA (adenosine(37)-N6)-dimethylallyltransferase MiaA [Bacteroidales bacterium]|nr:tRNA (adenosine(37)-N6)-dimethylallyltransferase MiaA [Bacteroidales bacterium]
MMNNTLIVILGPTGVGKSEVAVAVAGHFGSEIISADSRQFYREMKIGTAVPSDSMMKAIQHHFVQFKSINEYYSASLFERDVLELLPFLFEKNKLAIMAGGSGMYIDAVCNGIDDIPDTEPALREKYNARYREEGIRSLRAELKILDPEYYASVDLRNHKRIIRALEICETTGKPFSSFLTRKKIKREFRIVKIGLARNRAELYGLIDKRVDDMIEKGLEQEAKTLLEYRSNNALNSVGYKELFEFFDGRISREQAVELIKRNSRRYAKRQMTWWARDMEIKWFHPEKVQNIIGYIEGMVGS